MYFLTLMDEREGGGAQKIQVAIRGGHINVKTVSWFLFRASALAVNFSPPLLRSKEFHSVFPDLAISRKSGAFCLSFAPYFLQNEQSAKIQKSGAFLLFEIITE